MAERAALGGLGQWKFDVTTAVATALFITKRP